jgi:16S rRNA processing protein RimM
LNSTVADPTDPVWPEDAIEVGRIMDAWGLKGWIKIHPFASDPQALFSSRRWFLRPSEKPGPFTSTIPSLLKITQVKDHGDMVVALAQEVSDRSGAESLRGARIFVSRTSFPTPDTDEFYWIDLIGLNVVNREGVKLGTVVGLLETGPQSVIRIQPEVIPEGLTAEEAERLIPFVSAYVDDVSLEKRLITVDWGLDY